MVGQSNTLTRTHAHEHGEPDEQSPWGRLCLKMSNGRRGCVDHADLVEGVQEDENLKSDDY